MYEKVSVKKPPLKQGYKDIHGLINSYTACILLYAYVRILCGRQITILEISKTQFGISDKRKQNSARTYCTALPALLLMHGMVIKSVGDLLRWASRTAWAPPRPVGCIAGSVAPPDLRCAANDARGGSSSPAQPSILEPLCPWCCGSGGHHACRIRPHVTVQAPCHCCMC